MTYEGNVRKCHLFTGGRKNIRMMNVLDAKPYVTDELEAAVDALIWPNRRLLVLGKKITSPDLNPNPCL